MGMMKAMNGIGGKTFWVKKYIKDQRPTKRGKHLPFQM